MDQWANHQRGGKVMIKAKIKKIKLLLFPLFILFSGTAFADDAIIHFKDIFHIAKHDTSLQFLKMVFGNMPSVLSGAGESILHTMFREFNIAMMALASIVILYTVITSIINTAHQGEFLGKKLDSLWVPLRSVAGFVLIVPTVSGYSIIQIFMMWVVVQGIGAADTLWTTTVTYLAKGGPILAPSTQVSKTSGLDVGKGVLQNLVCMHRVYQQSVNTTESMDTLVPVIDRSTYSDKVGYNFMPDKIKGAGIDCGSIYWPKPSSTSDTDRQKTYAALVTGMSAMVDTLNTAAKTYVYQGSSAVDGDVLKNTVQNLNDAVADSLPQHGEGGSQEVKGFWKDAIDYGWANAGAYYYNIAKKNDERSNVVNNYKQYFDGSYGSHSYANVTNLPGHDDSTFVNSLYTHAVANDTGLTPSHLGPNNASGGGFAASGVILSILTGIMGVSIFAPLGLLFAAGGGWAAFATHGFHGHAGFVALHGFLPSLVSLGKGMDPMIALQAWGDKIVSAVETAFIIGFGILTGMAALAGICSAESPAGYIFTLMTNYMVFPALIVFGMLLTVGLTAAVYIPLIPYIIFFFGVLGWLIAVAETMVAAPMVALGLTHPEGHEIYGRAEPAINLMTNVFIRPSLMIFGLILAMLIARVGFIFLNALFLPVIGVTGAYGASTSIAKPIACDIIYISLVIALINRAFSLIHILPDKVLTWISNTSSFGEYAKGEENVKQGFSSGTGSMKGGLDGAARGGVGMAGGIRGGISKQIRDRRAAKKKK